MTIVGDPGLVRTGTFEGCLVGSGTGIMADLFGRIRTEAP